jgi:hypothetical protein
MLLERLIVVHRRHVLGSSVTQECPSAPAWLAHIGSHLARRGMGLIAVGALQSTQGPTRVRSFDLRARFVVGALLAPPLHFLAACWTRGDQRYGPGQALHRRGLR